MLCSVYCVCTVCCEYSANYAHRCKNCPRRTTRVQASGAALLGRAEGMDSIDGPAGLDVRVEEAVAAGWDGLEVLCRCVADLKETWLEVRTLEAGIGRGTASSAHWAPMVDGSNCLLTMDTVAPPRCGSPMAAHFQVRARDPSGNMCDLSPHQGSHRRQDREAPRSPEHVLRWLAPQAPSRYRPAWGRSPYSGSLPFHSSRKMVCVRRTSSFAHLLLRQLESRFEVQCQATSVPRRLLFATLTTSMTTSLRAIAELSFPSRLAFRIRVFRFIIRGVVVVILIGVELQRTSRAGLASSLLSLSLLMLLRLVKLLNRLG